MVIYEHCCCDICKTMHSIDELSWFKDSNELLEHGVCWRCYENWACSCGNKKLFEDDLLCETCQMEVDDGI